MVASVSLAYADLWHDPAAAAEYGQAAEAAARAAARVEEETYGPQPGARAAEPQQSGGTAAKRKAMRNVAACGSSISHQARGEERGTGRRR